MARMRVDVFMAPVPLDVDSPFRGYKTAMTHRYVPTIGR